MDNITPQDLAQWIANKKPHIILDVRENWEFDLTHIPGSIHIPLSNLSTSFYDITPDYDDEIPIVSICHHGVRSFHACVALESMDIKNTYNLTGGIDAYARIVDNSLKLY